MIKYRSTLIVLFLALVLSTSVSADVPRIQFDVVKNWEKGVVLSNGFTFSNLNYVLVTSVKVLAPILGNFKINIVFLMLFMFLFLSLVFMVRFEKGFNWNQIIRKLKFFHNTIILREKQGAKSIQTDQKFIEIIAHELSNTFHIMKGYSNYLNKEFDSLSKMEKKKYLNIINKNIEINHTLLKRLLVWNKSNREQSGLNKKQTNLKMLVENMLLPHHLFASRKKINIVNNLPEDLVFKMDKDVLRTVLSNLVNNAIKYSPENTEINIDAGIRKGKLLVSIKDQGKGLSVMEIERLLSENKENISFESNSKNKSLSSSNGFGINICKYLAKMHHGELLFESKNNDGTKATIVLPC